MLPERVRPIRIRNPVPLFDPPSHLLRVPRPVLIGG
jgi:hypothetical protein